METPLIVVIALAVLLFGAVSRRLQTTVVTPPMIFVLLGLLAGSERIGFVAVDLQDETIRLLAEFTLALATPPESPSGRCVGISTCRSGCSASGSR